MRKEIKVILSNTNVFSGNKGCEALGYSILYLISTIERESGTYIKVFLPESGHLDFGLETLDIGDRKISFYNILPPKFDIKSWVRLLFRPLNLVRSLKTYLTADFILDIGYGDSFSDIYGKKRFYSIYSEYILAKFFKIKTCVLPQTIGPYHDRKIEKKAFRAISRANLVFARDSQSYKYLLANHVSNKNIYEVIDVAFFLPYTKRMFPENFTHVGVNVSSLLWYGGYTGDNQFKLVVDYRAFIDNLIAYFLAFEDVVVHIIPHVVSGEYHVENDYAVSYHLVDELKNDRVRLSPFFLTPILAKSYISGLDFFVGSRMHATIAAFSSGVPVVPLAYSRKFNGLFMETLDYEFMGDLTSENEQDLSRKIDSAFINRQHLRKIIEERMNTIVREKENILKEQLNVFFEV